MMDKNEYDDGEAVEIEETANGGSLPISPGTLPLTTHRTVSVCGAGMPERKERKTYA